jgi:hypothetical protein
MVPKAGGQKDGGAASAGGDEPNLCPRAIASVAGAVVTNRRVICAPEGRNDVRDWSLEAVDPEPDGAPVVIDLRDGSEIDLWDSTTGASFAAAIHAAARAGPPSR